MQLSYHRLANHSIFCFSSQSQCSERRPEGCEREVTNHLWRERLVAVERMWVWWVHVSCKTQLTSSVLVSQRKCSCIKVTDDTSVPSISHNPSLYLPFSLFAQHLTFHPMCICSNEAGDGRLLVLSVLHREVMIFFHQTSSFIKLKTAMGHEDDSRNW